MRTERIEFPDGCWAEIQAYLSHGTARQVREVMQRHLKSVKEDVEIQWDQVDVHELHETMVLAGTVGWSYGTVDRDTLASIPEEHFQSIKQRMDTLYGGATTSPLAGNGAGRSGSSFSLRSFVANRFRRN